MELLLSTGTVEVDNPSDFVSLEFELVPADPLFSAKRQILDDLGFETKERFAIFPERIPMQMLSFLRLSRVQDAGQFAQVRFLKIAKISFWQWR